MAGVVFRRLAPRIDLSNHVNQYFEEKSALADADLEPVLTSAGRILEMTQGFAPAMTVPAMRSVDHAVGMIGPTILREERRVRQSSIRVLRRGFAEEKR